MPGGNPVIAVPGETPRSPLILLGPVFVMVLAPSTANAPAVPSRGLVTVFCAYEDKYVTEKSVSTQQRSATLIRASLEYRFIFMPFLIL
jgi:hypothetical protein